MKTFEISGSVRTELGKKANKALRKNNQVPCVLYGGEENIHFVLSENELRQLIFTDQVYIVVLNIDGKKYNAIIKDTQFHPVSDSVLHMDFLLVTEDKPMTTNVPVKMVGSSEGVKAGGKLHIQMRYLRIKGLMKNIPDFLEVDITKLELGKSIQVGELSYDNLELLNAKNAVLVSVKLTRAARGAATTDGTEEAND